MRILRLSPHEARHVGENANREPRERRPELPDQRATARKSSVAAPAPHAAENRFTRQAIVPIGISVKISRAVYRAGSRADVRHQVCRRP